MGKGRNKLVENWGRGIGKNGGSGREGDKGTGRRDDDGEEGDKKKSGMRERERKREERDLFNLPANDRNRYITA